MAHSIVYFEIAGKDIDRLEAFYKGVFEWQVRDSGMPGVDYRLIQTGEREGEGVGGGMYKRQAEEGAEPAGQILVYFGVESMDEYVGRIQSLGGRILQPTRAIPTVGYIAVASDPEGNVFALFQGDESAA